jgi:RNA polymerase sigma factor for flagellar operon FliA
MQLTSFSRDVLIQSHLGLARRIAKSYARRVPASVRYDDLEGAALLGLTEAAGRFDEAQADAFVGFAARRIRGAILDELRRHDPLSRRGRVAVKKLQKTAAELRTRLGRDPSDEELAEELGWTEEELARHRLSAETSHLDVAERVDLVATDPSTRPDEQAAGQEIKQQLGQALAGLRARDLEIIDLYYVEGLTLREIGSRLGVTESRVCQLHGRTLAHLKKSLPEEAAYSMAA